jgi:hypothetical protein
MTDRKITESEGPYFDAENGGWQTNGDPCNDCGEPAAYEEGNGWYYHIDPDAPECFLMTSRRKGGA